MPAATRNARRVRVLPIRMHPSLSTLLVLVLALIASVGCSSNNVCMFLSAEAYSVGDSVSMLQRTQYKTLRSGWTEVLAHDAPRFAEDKVIQLHPLQQARHYESSHAFKMSLSFDHDRHLLPWITVADGTGTLLRQVDITFTFSGDRIVRVNHTTMYHIPHLHSQPDGIVVRYLWHEHTASSSLATSNAAAWPTLLLGSLALIAFSILAAFIDHSRTSWDDLFPAWVDGAASSSSSSGTIINPRRLTKEQRRQFFREQRERANR